MCRPHSRKRPRSDDQQDRRRGIGMSPEPNTTNSYEDAGSAVENGCASEAEPEADTSFESPASVYSLSSHPSPLSTPPTERKRVKVSSATDHSEKESTDKTTMKQSLSAQRDEIVGAILTIASALGLTKETLHVCVDLLDRYLALSNETNAARLETLSIACLWLAVKFIETPETITKKSIKQILKRRRHSGNWTWHEIIRQEGKILSVLHYRLMAPTVLSTLQAKLHADGASLSHAQRQLAFYFADLLLLKHRAKEFASELLVDAIWFIITGHQIADVRAPLLAPVVILFLAHRDNINPQHASFKSWFALRCQYGPTLTAPWQLPYDPKCQCRVCEHSDNNQTSAAA